MKPRLKLLLQKVKQLCTPMEPVLKLLSIQSDQHRQELTALTQRIEALEFQAKLCAATEKDVQYLFGDLASSAGTLRSIAELRQKLGGKKK